MKKDLPFISLKACPVCGEHPDCTTSSLGKPGNRGYPGHYTYQYACRRCKLLKSGETTDIYIPSEEAQNLAKELWNEEVERVEKIMSAAKRC